MAGSTSKGLNTKKISPPSIPNAIAIPAPITPKPICITLQMTNEEFGKRLNSIHNIRFLIKIMEGARKAIQEDRFKAELQRRIIAKYGDERGF
jgi:hypothetical protein